MPIRGAEKCWPCMKGYYCPANISDYSPFPCPEGHFCPNGTDDRFSNPCPIGKFRNQTLGQNESDCFPCPPGEYCAGRLTKPDGKCSAGYFCVRGSKSSKPIEYNNFTSGDCLCPTTMTGVFLFVNFIFY